MGWIADKKPPEGLQVLLELSGTGFTREGSRVCADHDYYLGSWVVPTGEKEGKWCIETDCDLYGIEVHAFMPLPKHYAPKEFFEQEEDLMEHAMFEDDPDWLYKDENVFEGQMTIEDWLTESKKND